MTTKIVERVRKMIALANDSAASEGERENALRMAYATLSKYNLDIDVLEIKEGRECLELFGFPSPWSTKIAMSISNLFFCNYYITRTRKFTHTFIGKTSNVVSAQLLSDYVMRSVRKEAGKRQRDEWLPSSWNTSFCKGAADTIRSRCLELRKIQETVTPENKSNALVIISLYKSESEANAMFLKESLGITTKQTVSRERSAGNGYYAGKEFGNNINLSTQVSNKQTLYIS